MEPFTELASIYDLLYQDKSYADDARAIGTYIRSDNSSLVCDDPYVLSVGCGTGRYEEQLNLVGFRVVGIDPSAGMLDVAIGRWSKLSKEAQGRLTFLKSDLLSYSSPESFDVVLVLFHVLNYLTGEKGLKDGIIHLAKLIKPGGLCIFDSWNLSGVEEDPPREKIRTVKQGDTLITRKATPTLSRETQQVLINFDISFENTVTGESRNSIEQHHMSYFARAQITQSLTNAGFENIRTYRDLDFSKDSSNTFSLTWVARKTATRC